MARSLAGEPYRGGEMRSVPGLCNQIQTLTREAEPQSLISRIDGVTRALEIIMSLALQFIHVLRGQGYLHKFEFAKILYPNAASASAQYPTQRGNLVGSWIAERDRRGAPIRRPIAWRPWRIS